MRRLTVHLSDSSTRALKRLAIETRRSEAEIIREAVDRYIEAEQDQEKANRRKIRGLGESGSGQPDLAQRDEEILGEAAGRDW